MPNKRDTSKQKRARENRAQREALQARKAAASVAPEERRTRASANPVEVPKGKAARAAERSARTRPVRPGDVAVDVATLEGNFVVKVNQVPGGRQVLYAFAVTLVSAITLAIGTYPESEAKGADKVSFFEAVGSAAWPLLIVPPAIAALAVAFSLHPRRRRVWTIAAVALGAMTLAAIAIYLVNLLAVGMLVFGIQRAAKIEGPARAPRRARGAAADEAEATVDEPEADDDDA